MQSSPSPNNVPRIDLADAKKRFDHGDATFVDVRSSDRYQESHIPGALSIPLAELLRRVEELPKDRDLVLY